MQAAIQANPFLMMFGTLIILLTVGGAAHILFMMFDNARAIKWVDKATMMGALGTIILMGLSVISKIFEALQKFMSFIYG
jgi:hypothetical protein